MLIVAVDCLNPKYSARDWCSGISCVYLGDGQFRLLEIVKNQLLIITRPQPNSLGRLRCHHIGVRDGDLCHLVTVYGDASQCGSPVLAGRHIHVVSMMDTFDFKYGTRDNFPSLSVSFQNGQCREHLVYRRDGNNATPVHSSLIHMCDNRLLQLGIGSRYGHFEKCVHSFSDIRNNDAAIRIGGLCGNDLTVLDHVEHGALNRFIGIIQFDQLDFDFGVVFKNQVNIMFTIPIELLPHFVRITADGIPIRRGNLRCNKGTNGHGVPGNVLQITACTGRISADKFIVHTLDFDDCSGQTFRGIIRIYFSDGALAGNDWRVGKRHNDSLSVRVGKNHVLGARIIDLIVLWRRQFRDGVCRCIQIGERNSPVTPSNNFLFKGPVGVLYEESSTRKRLIGIGCIHFFNGELIPLPGDCQVTNNDALNIIGGVLGRAGTSVVILIHFAVAPYSLGTQVQNILGSISKSRAVYNIINAGIVGMLQIVIDVHQFFSADRSRIIQGSLLIAPDHCLHPCIHGPGIVRTPNFINAQGVRLIRKNTAAMGIEISHHNLNRLIIDGLRTIPLMTI